MENAHPLVVHFPIALFVTAFALETIGLIFRWESARRVAWWNLAAGSLGAVAAVLTGRAAAATAKHSFEIHQVMTQHERAGYLVLWLLGVVVAWRLASRTWRVARPPLAAATRWIGWVMLAVLCGTLAYGAHLGGRLVYEYGVGGSFGRSSGGIEVINEH